MLIIHGTKVRHIPVGVLAFDCPICGYRAVGDVTKVQTASHIYYIPMGWKDHSVFMTCRRCLAVFPVAPTTVVAHVTMDGEDEPSAELIQATNPLLPAQPPAPPELEKPLPPEVPRERWALLRNLAPMVPEARKDNEGWAALVALPGIVVAILLGIWVANWRQDDLLGVAVGIAVTVLSVYGGYQLRNRLALRTLNLRAGVAVQRYLQRTGSTPAELLRT